MSRSVTLEKGKNNMIGISIGGGAPFCPVLYIVQVGRPTVIGTHSQHRRACLLKHTHTMDHAFYMRTYMYIRLVTLTCPTQIHTCMRTRKTHTHTHTCTHTHNDIHLHTYALRYSTVPQHMMKALWPLGMNS